MTIELPMVKPVKEVTEKKCNVCGVYHDPEKVRKVGKREEHGKGGVFYWFNCTCGSTLTCREAENVSS